MTVEHIIPCICCDHIKNSGDSVYYGMPQLKVSGNYIKHLQFWTVFCPNCGRGGIIEYKSPYLALKAWNEMQKCLHDYEKKEIVIQDKDYWQKLRFEDLKVQE